MTKWLQTTVPLVAGVAALAWMCWHFGLSELQATFGRISPARLLLYLILSGAVIAMHTVRWQLVTYVLGAPLPLLRLVAARVAGDAVGALVPSAKLAGEPVRVALVYADGVAATAASAGVSIDRLLEMISSMLCFVLYVSVFSLTHVGSARPAAAIIGVMLALLAALAVPLVMLRRGVAPLAPLYGARAQRWLPPLARWLPALRRTEAYLLRFFRDHAGTFGLGLLMALGTEALVICQYHVLLSAFAVTLDLPTLLLALVGTGFARSLPTPAGLGALEASQVSVLALAAGRPAIGFVVGVVMRLHETFWIIVGLTALSGRGMSLARLRAPSPAR